MRQVILRWALPVVGLLALLVMLPSCGRKAGTNVQPAVKPEPAISVVADVKIKDYKYVPEKLTVKPGTTVRWTNYDQVAHTVTAAESKPGGSPVTDDWTSPEIVKGKTFERKFDKVGEYSYFCKPHAYMKGTIIVK